MKNPWRATNFRKVNKPWGHCRRVIGELRIPNTDAVIYLMKENDDGRESIAMHDARNGRMIVNLGFYWTEPTVASRQWALDLMYKALMK